MKLLFGKREARMSYNRIYISNLWRDEFGDKCYCRMASYMSQNNEKINAIVIFRTKDNMERLNCMCPEFDRVGEYLTDTFEAKISYCYITVPKKYRELCQLENGKQFIQVGLVIVFVVPLIYGKLMRKKWIILLSLYLTISIDLITYIIKFSPQLIRQWINVVFVSTDSLSICDK